MRDAVITIAAGRHEHLRAQRRSLQSLPTPPDLHVVVSLGDPLIAGVLDESPELATVLLEMPDTPLGLPLAAGRNAGARAALDAGADVLVFLDVDCLAGTELLSGYRTSAADPRGRRALLCGPVTYLPPAPEGGWGADGLRAHRAPHPARPDPAAGELVAGDPALFWSLSFCTQAEAWTAIGGFCETYVGYGGEDTDFARLAAAAGIGLVWVGGADAFHQHHPTETPPVQHLADILRNGRIFADRWGSWPMTGWLEEFERRGLVNRRDGGWERVGAGA